MIGFISIGVSMSTGVYDYYFDQSASYRQTDSTKYFGLSILVHSCLLVTALFVTVPALENLKNEPIVIELTNADLPTELIKPIERVEIAKGEKIKPTRGGKMQFAPAASASLDANDADVIKGPTKLSSKSQSKIAKVKTKTSGGQAAVARYAPSRAGVPETIEDIPAPKLDFDGVEAAQVGQLGDDAFENEFKNIDKYNEAALRAEHSVLDNQTKRIADENDSALKALEDKIAGDARVMENSIQSTRTKNAAALAKIQADEKAAADKAAREQAALLAQSRRAGSGSSEGLGSGTEGATNTRSLNKSGDPRGVRDISQLRQVPGNPKPTYSVDERLRREQGRVTFQAYVTPDGRLTQFTLLQSTGYKNLDGKTLAALKKWKFYPGQQGWVEIPQVWTLKGDAQEMPVLLRRQVSQK